MSPVRFWQRVIRCFRRKQKPTPPAAPVAPEAPDISRHPDDALRSAVECLLEDEALTADVVDPAARHLLDWGIARATAILQETGAASEESRARLAALRQQMRGWARQVGEMPPEEQIAALQRLLESWEEK